MSVELFKTLVIQSHRQPPPYSWLASCTESVRKWCQQHGYEYRFYDDEIFDLLDPLIQEKFSRQKVVLTDLARLLLLKQCLREGYDRVIWLDADMLIFAPEQFCLPELWQIREGYMLGREVWVQNMAESGEAEKWKAYVKVHNAFLLFDRGNHFLDFYLDQAERFLHQCETNVPPQFIGPKLLTALHNVIQCPVMESAGMLSPTVVLSLLSDGVATAALDLMRQRSKVPLAAANLCSSMVATGELSNGQMQRLVETLLSEPRLFCR